MGLGKAIARLWHTLRHYGVRRLVVRSLRGLRLARARAAARTGPTRSQFQSLSLFDWGRSPTVSVASDMLSVHGMTVSAVDPARWLDARLPTVALFELHGLSWMTDRQLPRATLLAALRRWAAEVPVSDQVAWDPWVTASRALSLVRIGGLLPPAEAELAGQLLVAHGRYLARSVEWDLGGNHLWRSGAALVVLGHAAEHSEAAAWRRLGGRILDQCVVHQVLPDGGHVERSPWYHLVAARDLLDAVAAVEKRAGRPAAEWRSVLGRMFDWLAVLAGPGGRLPLFNDSLEATGWAARDTLAHAARLGLWLEPRRAARAALPHTGYYRVDAAPFTVAADFGSPGSYDVPGHVHADLFTLELFDPDGPVLVDGGVAAYGRGPLRRFTRSTAAHNTLEIDGVDQLDVWGAFRVGRWCEPRDVAFHDSGSQVTLRGWHDGYGPLPGAPTHGRALSCDPERRHWVIEDAVSGRGRHRLTRRFRLAGPDVRQVAPSTLEVPRAGYVVQLIADQPWVLEAASWWPAWGEPVPAVTAVLDAEADLPWQGRVTVAWSDL